MEIGDALATFYRMYAKCDAIAAHNIWFDSKMIRIECMRNRYPNLVNVFFENVSTKPISCTMMKGMEFCELNRFVKLSVLYELLFKEDANQFELHNSLVDTMVCLRCYLKIFCDKEISDADFAAMIQ